jgi:hypothetical protein
MITEVMLNIALVLISMGVVIVAGLWALNGMMDDEPNDQRFYGDKTAKPPSEQ